MYTDVNQFKTCSVKIYLRKSIKNKLKLTIYQYIYT